MAHHHTNFIPKSHRKGGTRRGLDVNALEFACTDVLFSAALFF